MQQTDAINRYRDLRASGQTVSQAVKTLRQEGADLDMASNVSWLVETGKAAPRSDDHRANAKWYAGHEKKYHGRHLDRDEI